MTLNVAHGRKDALHQVLVSRATTQRNLQHIANLLTRIKAQVVALQEADAPSTWSGGFNHVVILADLAGYACYQHGHHAQTWLYTFGTALLSNYRFIDAWSHSFAPSPPTTTKGFVLGTLDWRPDGNASSARRVTLVSVHLDFSRRKVREAQVEEMAAALAKITTPVIILGDFNADWSRDDSPVRVLSERFDLRVFAPKAESLGTYKSANRLDWILISQELEFRDYAVLPDVVSDHLAVVAEVEWAEDE